MPDVGEQLAPRLKYLSQGFEDAPDGSIRAIAMIKCAHAIDGYVYVACAYDTVEAFEQVFTWPRDIKAALELPE